MPPDRPNAETLFHQALEVEPNERAAFLTAACRNNTALRRRIDALLAAHEQAKGFLPGGTTLPEQTPLTEMPGTVIGRYKLLEKIGEGGFGAVYVAEQREPVKRRVALKIIKLGMDTRQVVARFEAERQALALMDHPNIAKVLDGGATETGRPYFVMELVRGIPITQYCDENHLSANERLKLFMLVCQATQHAHQKGIIHRDIKPSNILLTVNDGVPVPKVIDFGIAKATQGELTEKTIYTQFQQFIGTPAYMSPEQADMTSLDIDTRSDIYALGVLLYELLVGKTPFDGKELLLSGLDEMRKTIREREPVRPSTKLSQTLAAAKEVGRSRPGEPRPSADEITSTGSAHGVTRPTAKSEEEVRADSRRPLRIKETIALLRGDLDWIVMKCLEKDRTRRYETANGLAADINRFLTNEPVLARPPSTAYRFQKAFRRNKLSFTAAAAIGVVLAVGAMVSTWQAFEASRARNAERKQRLAAQTERDKARTAQTKAERAQGAEKQERLRADAEKIIAERHLYVANMSLAQQAWEQNNIGRLRQLLEESEDSPHRGFEWYYWQWQTHLALKTLKGHLEAVVSVAFSPDGLRIVTGSGDQTAKVWEAASGRELFALEGHGGWIRSVAFSPDGQQIVTGSDDQTAKVWEAASGRELLTLKAHKAPIWSVAFSPDGQRIVTGSNDQTAKVWETASGRELPTLKGHGAPIWSVAFSLDGQRIITGSSDQTAKVWEAASGRELFTLKGHSAPIWSVAFSSNGQQIVTGSSDRTAKVWGAISGRGLLTFEGHSNQVWAVAFSPDGQRIVTGSSDQTAKVWEEASDRELLTLKGHTSWLRSAAFSADGQRIVTGSGDRTARVWDVASGRELLSLKGHSAAVRSAAFSSDGHRIVTSSDDETARVWDAATGGELLTLKGHSAPIRSVAFSADDQRIVTGSEDQTAKVWEAARGRLLLTLKGHSAPIRSVAFALDGQRIVTGSKDQTAKVWEAASGRELLTLKGHSAAIGSAAFSPDGHRIITGSEDQTAKVWEAVSGRELLTLKGHSAPIWSVAFSPDGERIITGSADQTAKVWQAARAKQVAAWQEEERTAAP